MVFGAERTGLTNEDLEAAHVLIRIPANEGLPVAQSRYGRAARDVRDLPSTGRAR